MYDNISKCSFLILHKICTIGIHNIDNDDYDIDGSRFEKADISNAFITSSQTSKNPIINLEVKTRKPI